MNRWFERFPERLADEKQRFADDPNLEFALDEQELSGSGVVVFRGRLLRDGKDPAALSIVYPDSFPYLRPQVYADDLRLSRHQNPRDRNLCLLDRSTREWYPSDTGAWLVKERVPLLLDAIEEGPDAVRAIEVAQGEPASTYYYATPGAVVFVPQAFLGFDPAHRTGTGMIAVRADEGSQPALRGCLAELSVGSDKDQEEIATLEDDRLRRRFPQSSQPFSWARVDELPLTEDEPERALLKAVRATPGFERSAWKPIPGGRLRVTGVVFSEEVRHEEHEDAWIFLVEWEHQKRKGVYVAHASRLSERDLGERVPTLAGLSERSVALAGLGAVGAPVAFELARAQLGRLRVLDGDAVEAGTIVRWPAGIRAVGHTKVDVVRGIVNDDYPFTETTGINHYLGATGNAAERLGDAEALEQLLDGADLLIDATAEIGVQQLLAAVAEERGLAQIYASITEGGLGGLVARCVPGVTGCWRCLQLGLDDGSIPMPASDPEATLQPRGCASLTFTGTSFSAVPVVAQAMRVATETLLGGRPEQVEADHDVFVMSLPPARDRPLAPPEWAALPLRPHPECGCHDH